MCVCVYTERGRFWLLFPTSETEALYISALLAKVIAKPMAMNIVNIVPHYIVNIIN